jgi:dienelactone hydrolase
MGRSWRAVALVAAAVLGIMGFAAPVGGAPDAAVTEHEVSFTGGGGVRLHGSVLAPARPGSGRRPGLVLVGGASNAAHDPVRSRDDLLPEARSYAARGLAVLVYDKRTTGYSLLHRDYGVLATDALAAVALLRGRPGVDPARVGLWGLSEGAWVVSIAAARSAGVAFVVTVGAVGLTPARQTAWANDGFLRHAGVSGSLPGAARTVLRLAISAGLFPEATFDPLPVWRRVHQPVLLLWGTEDRQAAPAQSAPAIGSALRAGGNTRWSARFLPADHNLHSPEDGGFGRHSTPAPGSAALVTSWVLDPAHATPGTGTAAPPRQLTTAAPLPPLDPRLWLVTTVALLVAFTAYPLVALVRRIAGRRRAPAVRGPARLLVAAGLVGVLGTAGYLLFVLATGAGLVGPVVAHRTVPWLVLQAVSAVAVLALVATAASWWRHRATAGDPGRLGTLVAAGALFVPWALAAGLLLP